MTQQAVEKLSMFISVEKKVILEESCFMPRIILNCKRIPPE
jgi:hypothetical protein